MMALSIASRNPSRAASHLILVIPLLPKTGKQSMLKRSKSVPSRKHYPFPAYSATIRERRSKCREARLRD